MAKTIEVPVFGNATAKCVGCRCLTAFSGLLFTSLFDTSKPNAEPERLSVRNCPFCNSEIVPVPEITISPY